MTCGSDDEKGSHAYSHNINEDRAESNSRNNQSAFEESASDSFDSVASLAAPCALRPWLGMVWVWQGPRLIPPI